MVGFGFGGVFGGGIRGVGLGLGRARCDWCHWGLVFVVRGGDLPEFSELLLWCRIVVISSFGRVWCGGVVASWRGG